MPCGMIPVPELQTLPSRLARLCLDVELSLIHISEPTRH